MDTKIRWLCALTLVISCASAHAAVQIDTGNNPQPGQENVLFQSDMEGFVVTGKTNDSNTPVTFTGDEKLAASGGQARIEAVDGAFDFLRVEILGGTFKSLILDLNAIDDGYVEFTTTEIGMAPVTSSLFSLSKNGNNFFTIVSTLGLEYISLSTDVGMTSIGLSEARQFRIGGIAATPEPASLMIWSTITVGAVAVAARLRHKGG